MVRQSNGLRDGVRPRTRTYDQPEYKRQARNIELIASENIVSEAVMAAMGSVLTINYAEGYPVKRYGCECVDEVENLAIHTACASCSARNTRTCGRTPGRANEHGGLSGRCASRVIPCSA